VEDEATLHTPFGNSQLQAVCDVRPWLVE
jgi:hypothetical protein